VERKQAFGSTWSRLGLARIMYALPEPLVQATVDGGVQFEWEQDNRELDIEVSSAGELCYLKVISRAAVEEGPLDLDSLRSLTNWLRSGR
jgi:hypothetical protein